MTNVENQKIRDKEKWLESEAKGYDMSGAMYFCEACEFSNSCRTSKSGFKCDYGGTTGDFEIVPNPCATAYNRLKRRSYELAKKNFKETVTKKCISIMNN
jgi:hypothetical protein